MSDIDLFKVEFENLIEEDVDTAIAYCIESLEKNKDFNIYLYLGEAHMAKDNFEESLIFINRALKGNCSDKVLAYSLQGESLFYLNMYKESRLAFNEVLKIEQMSFFASVYIIDIDIYEGNYLEAIRTIDKLLNYGKLTIEDLAFLETKKGWILFKYLEKKEEAFKLFKESIKKDSNCGTSYVGLGYYFLYKKEYEKAVLNFNLAIELGEGYELVYEGLDIAKGEGGEKYE